MNKEHWELTGEIIGGYYEVYNHLSHTYPERMYERALREELRRRGLASTRQEAYAIQYKERLVGWQQLDLFVVDSVVVENKVAERLTRLHKAQCISYIKTVEREVGLLLNFGGERPEHHRLYFDPAKRAGMQQGPLLAPGPDWLYPELTYEVIGGLFEVHRTLGAGFVYRIYANACAHELGLRGLALLPSKRMEVRYKGVAIGEIAFAHLVVENKLMLFPVAIGKLEDIRLDNLKQWMQQCQIPLGLLANFDATHLQLAIIRS